MHYRKVVSGLGLWVLGSMAVASAEETPAPVEAAPNAPASPPTTPPATTPPNAPNPAAPPDARGAPGTPRGEAGSTPDQPKLLDRETALRAYTKARLALEAADKATREKGAQAAADGKNAAAEAGKALEGANQRLEQARTDAAAALEDARTRLQAAGRELSKIEITPQLQAAVARVLEPADEQRRRTRGERADAARADLKKKHGAALDKPGAQEQLERHAWRVARLNRLIELADAAGQKEAGDRARALLAKEEAANTATLQRLATEKVTAPAPSNGVANGVAP